MFLKAVACKTLSISNSDIQMLSGVYGDEKRVYCEIGYYTEVGKATFLINCDQHGFWRGLLECRRKSFTSKNIIRLQKTLVTRSTAREASVDL